MGKFKENCGDWTQYRKLPNVVLVDEFHHHQLNREKKLGPREHSYDELMVMNYELALDRLRQAYEDGRSFALFLHGDSTSGRGKSTNRSQVRKLMRSKFATPYIDRSQCIQHPTVFVAAIKHKTDEAG